jgi:hypothetical protein
MFGTRYKLRYQVLAAAGMKMTAFWDVALCSLVERRNVPEDNHLQDKSLPFLVRKYIQERKV